MTRGVSHLVFFVASVIGKKAAEGHYCGADHGHFCGADAMKDALSNIKVKREGHGMLCD